MDGKMDNRDQKVKALKAEIDSLRHELDVASVEGQAFRARIRDLESALIEAREAIADVRESVRYSAYAGCIHALHITDVSLASLSRLLKEK